MRSPTAASSARRVLTMLVALCCVAVVLATPSAASATPKAPAPAHTAGTAQLRASTPQVVAPGTIEATVSTPDGSAVDGLLQVYVWKSTESAFVRYDADVVARARTSPATLSAPVAAGSYYVRFAPSGETLLPSYGGGATTVPTTLSGTGVVAVSATTGAATTVALRRAPASHRLSGTLRGADGTAASDVLVEAAQVDGEGFASTASAPDGTFALSLAEGTWSLALSDDTGTWVARTLEVAIGRGDLLLPVTVLRAAGTAHVSGRVLGADARPVAGAVAELHVLHDDDPGRAGWESSDWVAQATTGTDGRYTIAGAVPGETYTVAASAPGHLLTVLGGGGRVVQAAGFAVTGTPDPTSVPDLSLQASSRLSGTVRDSTGANAAGVDVVLVRWSSRDSYFYDDARTTTDAEGHYGFATLVAGDYALRFEADPTSQRVDSAWLEGAARPTALGAPGTFTVTTTPAQVTRDKVLPRPAVVVGTVRDAAGVAQPGVTVTSYPWVLAGSSGRWEQGYSTTTGADGTYRLRAPRQSQVTLRFSRLWWQTAFLGGTTVLPALPSTTNAVETGAALADTDAGVVVLAPKATSYGAVAGQRFDYCRDHRLPLALDASSGAIDLPRTLPVRLGDRSVSQLWVNSNGTVSFDGPDTTPVPTALAEVRHALVAPFWADWDARPNEVPVTWGLSPEGTTFCAVWSDSGYGSNRSDKLNTVQLLIRSAQSGSGRQAGDVDLTMNYDTVQWNTADSGGGYHGLGGTASAVVGWTAGSGAAGTVSQLSGSLTDRALIDSNRTALIKRSQGSTQLGRYVYEVRNSALAVGPGSLTGTVVDTAGRALPASVVRLCPSGTTAGCATTRADSQGGWSFARLLAGSYDVRVWGSDDTLLGATTTATARDGQTVLVAPVVLRAPTPLPANATLTSLGATSGGVPRVDAGETLALRVTGCVGLASPTYAVTTATNAPVRAALPLTESPAGVYRADVAALGGTLSRDLRVSTTVPSTCGAAPTTFSVQSVPAGVVVDSFGRPLDGASLTLLRSGTQSGTYTAVPSGSDLLTPDRATLPVRTTSEGTFSLEPAPGWYELLAVAPGCTSTTTAPRELPSARFDLAVVLSCDAPAPSPTTAPRVTGDPSVGSTLVARPATWAGPLTAGPTELLRNDVVLSSTTRVLSAADLDAVFTARSVARRPERLRGAESTTFSPVAVTSTPVTGTQGAAPSATVDPRASGSGAVGTELSLGVPTWDLDGVASTPQWLREGQEIPGATAATYTVTPADLDRRIAVRVTGLLAGHSPGSATSATVLAVRGAAPVAATAPTVTGAGRVDTTLSASAPIWDQPGVVETRTWLRDGTPIAGADLATYDVRPGDLGHTLAVRFTATLPGHVDGEAVSSTRTVLAGTAPSAGGSATTSGAGQVGTDLVAAIPTWDLSGTVTSRPQWLRDGAPVVGATSATYRLVPADLGHDLAVRWGASLAGHDDGVTTSTARRVLVGTAATATTGPAVTGDPHVGQVLTASTGAWDAAGLTYATQWLRDDTAISGATAASYALVPADAGHRLAVRVTATREGYAAGVASSASLEALPGPAASLTSAPTLAGDPLVGATLTVTTGTWDASGLWFGYQWLRDGAAIPGASTASYVLDAADLGHQVSARVVAGRPGYLEAVTTTSAVTGLLGRGAVATTAPGATTPGGPTGVEDTLTAQPGTWDLPGLAFTYQWLRSTPSGLVAIDGASARSYVPSVAELGQALVVRVGATRAGYADGEALSAPVVVGLGSAPRAVTPPTLLGPGRVGAPLEATAPVWDRPGTSTGTAQWLRDGEPIALAPGAASYTPVAGDLGHTISVRWTATLDSHLDATVETPTLTVLTGAAATTLRAPVITGTPRVGETLSAEVGDWDAPALDFGFQWLRDGTPIAGADAATYVPGGDDAGHRLLVEVTATREGYAAGLARSAALDVARLASRTTATAAQRTWGRREHGVLVVGVVAPGADPVAGALLVRDGAHVLVRSTLGAADDGVRRLVLPRLSRGRHHLVVSYAGSAAVLGSSDVVRVRVRR